MAKQYLMPYTNLHELNLDWLINAMKQLEASWDGLEMKTTASIETTAGNPEVIVSGSLKDTLNFDFKLPQGSAFPSTDTPLMDQNNGVIGVSEQFARGDHVHPSDTSKVDKIVPSTNTTYFYCQDTKNTFLTATQEYVLQGELTNAVKVKQDTLVSGRNIKTINNNSILGSGNINTNLTLDLLWTNTSINDFPAQTITLDLSAYNLILVVYGGYASYDGFVGSTIIPKGKECDLYAISYYSSKLLYNNRKCFPENTQITFGGGVMCYADGSAYAANNSQSCSPMYIYGVK